MPNSADRFSQISALLLMMAGALFYLVYLIFLPLQDSFHNDQVPDLGLMLYSLATAGAGFVAWGWMLITSTGQPLQYRKRILQASAIGFFMLGLMRVGTALFPHVPFQSMVVVPVSECVIFSLLGLVFLRKAALGEADSVQPVQ